MLSEGLTPELAARVLGRALRRGGDFAEVYAEEKQSLSVRLEDQKVEVHTQPQRTLGGWMADGMAIVARLPADKKMTGLPRRAFQSVLR